MAQMSDYLSTRVFDGVRVLSQQETAAARASIKKAEKALADDPNCPTIRRKEKEQS